MRHRGSLFAPLLLIGLGALFLARNIYPDLRLVDYLARYWPFLLVLWGLLRLVEIMYWRATNQQLPYRGVSGGEWVLVAFLVVFGVSLHTAVGVYDRFPREPLVFGGLDLFGESYDYPVNASKPASKTPLVIVEGFSGSARITGTDTMEVKVAGHKTVRSMDQAGADQANREANFEIAGDPNRVTIRTGQNRISGPRTITEDLEITVPKGASVELHNTAYRGRGGDFDLSEINGAVEIDSDSAGEVRLESIGGDMRLNLNNSSLVRAVNCKGALDLRGRGGDLDFENIEGTVSIHGDYSGMVEYHNIGKPLHYQGSQTEFFATQIPGQVRMPLNDFNASNLVGPLRLKTRFRDIEISDFSNSLELSTERGDIVLRPGSMGLGKIDAHATFGNITLALLPTAKFDINGSTGMGEVINDFGKPLSDERTGRMGASLHGSNGGPTVTLRTDRGNITVRTAGANEPPLEPGNGSFGRGLRLKGPKGRGPAQLPTTEQ